jgi:hypothetical protein
MNQPEVREEHSPRKLTKAEARARIGLVFGLELVGIAIIMIPLISQGMATKGWQRDCLLIGGIAGGVSVVILSLTHVVMGIRGINVTLTEGIIGVIFVVNTIAFAVAMARTGGPSCSVFGQIIPLQLSGMLLFEQQKEKMTSQHTYAAVFYTAITISIWVIAVLFRERFIDLHDLSMASGTGTEDGYGTIAARSYLKNTKPLTRT